METLNTEKAPSVNNNREQRALALWGLVLLVLSALYFTILPTRDDLSQVSLSFRFWLETFSWIPAIVVTAWLTFHKHNPSSKRKKIDQSKFLPIFAPFLLVFIRMHAHGDSMVGGFSDADLLTELDFYRGRCGLIILTTGVLASVIGLSIVRKQIFNNEIEIGGWALASSGCFGSFLMQFVCAHESPLHLFIWHFLPLMLLGVMALSIEKRFFSQTSQIRIQNVIHPSNTQRQPNL
jgi:hypothetical protein